MVFGNQLETQEGAQPDARGELRASGLTTELPFMLACGMACVRSGTLPDMRSATHAGPRYSPRGTFCELGLSALQINVLALVQRAGARVTPYDRIARQLAQEFGMQQSAESVRGIVNRLAARGFIRRKQARDGTIRGVRFTPIDALICPHITANRPDVQGSIQAEARPEPSTSSSILEEKIDRKNLSISSEKDGNSNIIRRLETVTEDDIAFHWPNLARSGFGTHQIRQILHRLEQVGTGPERIIQGLTHAEWELTAGKMYDQKDEPVASPVDWVFTSLARHGCYRKPRGYVSPQEQAERDAAKEAERIAAAHKERYEAEAAAWITQLTKDERHTILGSQNGVFPMPEDTALRIHFKEHIWPNIKSGNAQEMSNFEEGNGHGG